MVYIVKERSSWRSASEEAAILARINFVSNTFFNFLFWPVEASIWL
ncbi:hypothetical protein VP96_03639 [Vibrio cholerae]|nr:hypothetical protein VCEM1626_000424 [Vibrio cholerae O1 str. EM-1626]KKP08368.1 hypothetical protein VP96_03639 [Vibrio cholerae]KKP08607.1 hypothetical protein VS84_03629 [Vibrio cholerae]